LGGVTVRVGACCLPVAVLAVAGAASSTTLQARTRTLMTVGGHVDAFAQSTNRLAWLHGDTTCPQAEVFDLRSRRVVRISSRQGSACHAETYAYGGLAFDGKRVLWQMAEGSHNSKYVTIFTAALGDRHTRVMDLADFDRHPNSGPYYERPPPMAGAAGRLVYYQRCEVDCKRPGGVRVASGRRSHLLFKGTRPVGLSLAGGRLAVLEDAIGCCNLSPAWSPDGTRIAWYEGLLSHGFSLVVANADGTNRHVVGLQALAIDPPSWSPDGSRIAFSKPNVGVQVANADGSGEIPLAAGQDPVWSPDGTQVAFLRGSDGFVRGNDVFVVGSDGSQERRLTNDGISGTLDPRWSPDGTKLLVVRGGWVANTARAHVIDVASGSATVLAPVGVLSPAWSPDGSRIVYTTVAGTGSLRIAVMNADGSNPHLVTSDSEEPASNDVEPAWSPGGNEIAFTHEGFFGTTEQQGQVRVIGSDGSGLRAVSGLGSSGPAWSPMGRIAWGDDEANPSWRTGGLFTANADGTGLARLAGGDHTGVEIHSPRTGKLLQAFNAPGTAVGVEISSGFIAAVVVDGSRLKLMRYRRSGELLGSSVLPKVVHGLAIGGRTVLYATARRIFAVDAKTGRTRVLAATGAVPIGLSVVGRRAAWAENLRGHARIRELLLPR
jgi:sugar lactone lactonase YvrE